MSRVSSVRDCRGRGTAAALIVIGAALLGGCASGTFTPTDRPVAGSTGTSFSDRMNRFFFGAPAVAGTEAQASANEAPPTDVDCPVVQIRHGASTLTLNAPGAEPNALDLRYQVSIGRTARECHVSRPNMTIKVGVQGRVILGPQGGPGQIDVPIRYAVVQEGPEPKTIITKLQRSTIQIPAGQPNVPFIQVEEDLTFPIPSGSDLEAYVIYIGFDPNAAPEKKPRGRHAKPHRAG